MRPLHAATLAPILLAGLLLAAPARAGDMKPLVFTIAGSALIGLGYGIQAGTASGMGDGSKLGYVPIGGAMKLMSQAIRADCSRAPEGNCDAARVAVPAVLVLDLALELAGLGLATYGAGLAARQDADEAQARVIWAPFVSANRSAALLGVGGCF